MLERRALLGVMLAAPAIIRTPGLLMAIKPPLTPAQQLARALRAYGGQVVGDTVLADARWAGDASDILAIWHDTLGCIAPLDILAWSADHVVTPFPCNWGTFNMIAGDRLSLR